MSHRTQRIVLTTSGVAAMAIALAWAGALFAQKTAVARQTELLETPYDALEKARGSNLQAPHLEAGIPSQCYTKTDGSSNPCWTCHTDTHFPNDMNDWTLQVEYAFSEQGMENHWSNLFQDRKPIEALISDAEVQAYIQADNYSALRRSMAQAKDFPGYVPDLDFASGFDESGFARDGSGWRAFKYKPFPGTFWPTNGSTDDVLIRLPAPFQSAHGKLNLDVYKANLALLEASLASDPSVPDGSVRWPTEPLNESSVMADLDGDGKQAAHIHQIVGIPLNFVGDAQKVRLRRGLFPKDTEFLHSVRYVDPTQPRFIAKRMKELRYSRKFRDLDPSQILGLYAAERDERDAGHLPVVQGDALSGVRNKFGWVLQGYIEDARGRLRLQTHQEHLACVGCHSNLGVTVDNTFAFVRKMPGAAGWAYQDLRGMPDVPQLGHKDPEVLTYLQRVGGGDEFRSNEEMRERFLPGGRIDEQAVRRGALGGDRDLAWLILPSEERATALNRAYMALVRMQLFDLGRDAPLAPATQVHPRVESLSTGLSERGKVYKDGRLHLSWSTP